MSRAGDLPSGGDTQYRTLRQCGRPRPVVAKAERGQGNFAVGTSRGGILGHMVSLAPKEMLLVNAGMILTSLSTKVAARQNKSTLTVRTQLSDAMRELGRAPAAMN